MLAGCTDQTQKNRNKKNSFESYFFALLAHCFYWRDIVTGSEIIIVKFQLCQSQNNNNNNKSAWKLLRRIPQVWIINAQYWDEQRQHTGKTQNTLEEKKHRWINVSRTVWVCAGFGVLIRVYMVCACVYVLMWIHVRELICRLSTQRRHKMARKGKKNCWNQPHIAFNSLYQFIRPIRCDINTHKMMGSNFRWPFLHFANFMFCFVFCGYRLKRW